MPCIRANRGIAAFQHPSCVMIAGANQSTTATHDNPTIPSIGQHQFEADGPANHAANIDV
jgi:hypothetical protein